MFQILPQLNQLQKKDGEISILISVVAKCPQFSSPGLLL